MLLAIFYGMLSLVCLAFLIFIRTPKGKKWFDGR